MVMTELIRPDVGFTVDILPGCKYVHFFVAVTKVPESMLSLTSPTVLSFGPEAATTVSSESLWFLIVAAIPPRVAVTTFFPCPSRDLPAMTTTVPVCPDGGTTVAMAPAVRYDHPPARRVTAPVLAVISTVPVRAVLLLPAVTTSLVSVWESIVAFTPASSTVSTSRPWPKKCLPVIVTFVSCWP